MSFKLKTSILFTICMALSTFSMPSFWGKCIFFVENMSSYAMRFCRINRSYSITSHKVFSLCNGFQMIRVYTQNIFAQMIDLKTLRNNAFMYFIRKSVRVCGLLHNFQRAISFCSRCSPYPACICFFNFFKKSINMNFGVSHVVHHNVSTLVGQL